MKQNNKLQKRIRRKMYDSGWRVANPYHSGFLINNNYATILARTGFSGNEHTYQFLVVDKETINLLLNLRAGKEARAEYKNYILPEFIHSCSTDTIRIGLDTRNEDGTGSKIELPVSPSTHAAKELVQYLLEDRIRESNS